VNPTQSILQKAARIRRSQDENLGVFNRHLEALVQAHEKGAFDSLPAQQRRPFFELAQTIDSSPQFLYTCARARELAAQRLVPLEVLQESLARHLGHNLRDVIIVMGILEARAWKTRIKK
jgi:hypothetical protein